MNIAVSISASCLIYAILLKLAILMFNIPSVHEAGYICSMLFIIPGFPFITSGIDLAKLDLRSGIERLTYSIIIVLVATDLHGLWLCYCICSQKNLLHYILENVTSDIKTYCKLLRCIRILYHV